MSTRGPKAAHVAALFLAAVTAILVAIPHEAFANANNAAGLTGRTNRDTGAGCAAGGCHIGQDAGITVAITGSSALEAGQSGTYTVTVTRAAANATKVGMAIASSDSGLPLAVFSGMPMSSVGAVNLQELIHSSGVGALRTITSNSATYQFTYTMPGGAAVGSTHTLYAVSAVSFLGWNHAPNFSVTTRPLATTSATPSNPTTSSIDLAWTGGGPNYRVVYKTGAVAPANETDGTQVNLGAVNATTVTGLSASTQYSFKVFSRTVSGTVFSTTGATATATTSAPVTTFSLAVNKSGTGTVTSSPAGIDCGATCNFSFNSGTSVTLTATPGAGFAFSGWSGDCGGTGTCPLTMSAARNVTATFVPLTTFSFVINGAQESPPNAAVATGSGTATVNPVANTIAYSFAVTGLTGALTGAHFHGPAARGANAGIKIDIGGNPFSGTVGYSEPDEANILAGLWYVNFHTGAFPSGEVRGQLDNLAAPFVLTVNKAGAGSGTVTSSLAGISCGASCSATYASGASVTLTATPAGGSTFTGWSGSGCSGTGTCIVTMSAARAVTATFGTAGTVDLVPASRDFGGQSMNTTAPSQSVTVTNNSGAPVTVNSVTVSTYFAVTHDCTSLAAAASCTANITFTPTAAGALAGTLTVATSAGNFMASLAGTGEMSLVTHYYRSILRRAPDAGGKSFWDAEAARMLSLGVNVNETWYSMAGSFYTSAEYLAFGRDDAGFITDLYNTFFNRPPDGAGLTFWTDQLAAGLPREVALVAYMFSAEFVNFTQAIFGTTAVRAEINTVVDFYRGLLARLPDNGGFNFWVTQFRAAQCTGASAVTLQAESISSQYALSGEYAARARSNAQYVGDLYNAFLRRGGDLGGVLFWINQIATSAQTREQVRQQFVASPEFQAKVAAIIAQGCLP